MNMRVWWWWAEWWLNSIQGGKLFVQRRSHPSLHWQGDQFDRLDDDNQFDDLDESNTVLFEYWLMVMILLKIMHIYANHLPEVQLKEWWRWRWWKWWHFKCHNIIISYKWWHLSYLEVQWQEWLSLDGDFIWWRRWRELWRRKWRWTGMVIQSHWCTEPFWNDSVQ